VHFKIEFPEQILSFTVCEQIEIVEHTEVHTSSTMSKDELKAFMVGVLSILAPQ
jgi:hypothetical protein